MIGSGVVFLCKGVDLGEYEYMVNARLGCEYIVYSSNIVHNVCDGV